MNNNKYSRKPARGRDHLTNLLKGASLGLVSVFCAAHADDTEVFFGQVDSSTNVYPNVMFVLDTSGSMNTPDAGYSGTRLERMKSALNTILDSSSNVNVGLMRLNGYDGGGAVLYPVTGINEQICANNDCGTVAISKQVQELNDDMEQFLANGQMTPTGTRLSLAQYGNNSQLVSVRFQDLDIPSGVQITSAELEFTADSNSLLPSDLTIEGYDTGDAPTIGTTTNYLSTRPRTAAEVSWQPDSWYTGNEYQSPDIKNIVQEIVNRSDWCGGQSMAFIIEGTGERAAYAYTSNNASRAPRLRLSYDSTTIPENQGCTRKSALAQINSPADDAYEKVSTGDISTSDRVKLPMSGGNRNSTPILSRLHFRELAIPAGAIIESATLEFEVDSRLSGSLALNLQAEDVDSAPDLQADKLWISGRPVVADPVVWSIQNSDNWSENTDVTTPNLAEQVQSIVDRPGWQMNNDIAFIISRSGSSSNYRQFESYDTESPSAPKLLVTYQTNVGEEEVQNTAFQTARDDMKTVVNDLSATGGTPIVAAYYEAVQYMLGGAIDYGTKRGRYTHQYHRVSHPSSYTGGSVSADSRCTASNPQSTYCKSETIQGNPVYTSPLADSCQTNHIVFLSDGDATSNTAANKVKSLIGASSCSLSSGFESCGRELATWLDETDHNENMSRTQNISTYTIGFNINSSFLSDLASAGGGKYYDASSAEELVAVFQNILGDVLAVDTSFVAPGATVNQFNRLTHRNDIYFALFKPDSKPTWSGNLKRFYVGADEKGNVLIQDSNENPAVDDVSGFFLDTSNSWWSDTVDGGSVEKGGAAEQISLDGPDGVGDRRVFTYVEDSIPANGVDLSATAQKLDEYNTRITTSDLGLSSGNTIVDNLRRFELLKWARGVDVKDEDNDGLESDVRQHMGDPMHSQPVLLSYQETNDTKSTIFVSTNEGFLHAIEHENGTELYSYIPKELLPNLNEFYENQQSTKHLYGLDGSMAVWHNDLDNNVLVDPGEEAYLYLGMRRGGNHYYAIDVSDRLNPKLLWQIDGGDGDFEQLGQTWSTPIPTTISYNGEERRVLIFAGGYDTNQDPNTANLSATQSPDSVGNAIFIVDADTGDKLWAGQGIAGGDEVFAGMDYSIPGDIRVIDIDGDDLADQMYVGDMGGQLWRFDFEPYHQSGTLVYGGVIARLNGGDASEARRFYNEPDVALVTGEGQQFLSISFGSGWRAHPLNERVEDRFYMIRSNDIYARPDGYGMNSGTESAPDWEPVTESDLVNVTDDLDPELNDYGWMLEMEDTGEKVISQAVTVNNQVIFTSYEPTASGDACSAAVGGGSVYVVDVITGAPTTDLNDSDEDSSDSEESEETDEDDETENLAQYRSTTLTKEDRKKTLQQDGIPPSPTALITETDGNIGTTILVSTEKVDVDFDNLTQRTYWQDNGRGNKTPDEITAEIGE